MRFPALIENETLKILRRRRFTVVVAILASILALIAYSQWRELQRRQQRNWRVDVQQKISQYQNRLRSGRLSETWARSLRAEVARLQFYADHDIDPDQPTAPIFARNFAPAAGFLLLPLLAAMLGSDIVSSESSQGTDKLLLTRPVRRWKVLASKLAALWIFTTLTLFLGGLIAWGVSALVLDPRGWTAPTFNGFALQGTAVDLENIRQLPLWHDTLIVYGLEWYAMLVVAAIALLLSVIFKSSSAAIGTMLASLVGGTILTRISPTWTAAKYLFVSALPLADYYSGDPPPYDGMSLAFCVALLGVWGALALISAFVIFTRRDVFG
jgi:ABC-2 type transport system permease protein